MEPDKCLVMLQLRRKQVLMCMYQDALHNNPQADCADVPQTKPM
jgi:hypothetical protein